MKSHNFAEIANYTSACRKNYLNTEYGPSNIKFTQGRMGIVTGYTGATTCAGKDDGRSVILPLSTQYTWYPTKNWTRIEGNRNEVTITYEDASTEVLP